MTLTVTFHSTRVEPEIPALPAGQLARFIRYAERREAFGPDLGMPHTHAMAAGLFELRIKAAEGIARAFFCTVVDCRIVFLHVFVRIPAKLTAESDDDDRVESRGAWCSDSNVVGHHGG